MKKGFLQIALICFSMTAASLAVADDLDIFGGQLIDVKPNVLIVFDNSGSMEWCLDGTDPTDEDDDPTCTLSNNRMSIAKNAVKGLIDRVDGVHFGLMAFNQGTWGTTVYGGEILAGCGTAEATVKSEIDSLDPGGFTPLAETMAEAGLYFAGADSWFNGSTDYTSPITERCQKNYIVLMTDGEPTSDDHSNLCDESYVNAVDASGNLTGDSIGDYDNDKGSDGCDGERDANDYLDDVAKYLYENDILPGWGATPYEKQNVKTYVIGFTIDVDLLNDTAGYGGTGTSYSANNTAALNDAFNQILNEIQVTNAIYVAPVIPPQSENQSEAGDRVYMAFFKPQADGRWRGNLKGYKFFNGTVYDANDTVATISSGAEEGYLRTDARSLWLPSAQAADGREVDKGGVGGLLATRDPFSRKLYTYLWQENTHDLTDASKKNSFSKDNTSSHFNAALGVADDSARNDLIDLVLSVPDVAGDPIWPLGDIVHSEPLVEVYHIDANSNNVVDAGELKPYIFVGANDGMLHVFDGSDGSEAWGFVPPGQLQRLDKLQTDNLHDYFVDGSPVVADIDTTNTKKVLFFGERRGGDRYYALDMDDPLSPEWLYQINNTALSGIDWDSDGNDEGAAATLGQSWAKPQITSIKSGGVVSKVFLLTGGYDTNQDLASPAATDSVGRSIYAVKVEDGSVFGLNLNGALWSEMTHSIIDVTAFSARGGIYIDRVYAGDLGGKLFAVKYDESDDDWDRFVLLNLPAQYSVGGVNKTLGRKFMHKPEVTLEPEGECIYAGTGDSENPLGTGVVDAFYVACNKWEADGTSYVDVAGLIDPVADISIDPTGLPATPSSADLPDEPFAIVDEKLVDVSSDKLQNGTALEKAIVQKALDTGSGWFIRMEHDGEKITSSPQILNGRIFFTTFTPEGSAGGDVCTTSNDLGTSRLYMLDYKTGMAAYDLNDDDEKTKDERSIVIGTSIAYDPVLITSGGKTTLLYGAGGKLQARELETREIIRKYFWRQVN